jgi:hypothetical protein
VGVNYTLDTAPPGTYTIVPSKSGWVFDPPQAQVTVTNAGVSSVNFGGALIITFTSAPNGAPNPVQNGTTPVPCTVAASTAESVPLTYTWTCDQGYFQDVANTTHPRVSYLQNPVWIPDFTMSSFTSSVFVEIGVSASCLNGLTRTAYFVEEVTPQVLVQNTGSGCFIATAAFGSYDDARVQALRRFRDGILLQTGAGRGLVRWYYRHSPAAAAGISGSTAMRAVARGLLAPVYGIACLTMKGIAALTVLLCVVAVMGVRARRKQESPDPCVK